MRRLLAIALTLGLLTTLAHAAEPAKELKTLMTERGKVLVSDDMSKGLASEWKAAKGKWEAADGAVKAVELKDDMHAAVVRRPAAFRDAVIQYSFKLDGGKVTTFSVNGAKGHVCRVLVKPTGLTVQKDDTDGKTGPDKAAVLDTCAAEVKPGEWHTLVIEIHGKELVARLDDKHVAFGSHDAIAVDKANVGLTVAGESVSFKDFKMWEATPSKDWDATKAKLIETRK